MSFEWCIELTTKTNVGEQKQPIVLRAVSSIGPLVSGKDGVYYDVHMFGGGSVRIKNPKSSLMKIKNERENFIEELKKY